MIVQKDIDKLKIEEILEYYALKYRVTSIGNANFCCPFHGDSNPSCGMHVETGLWKCFGCGISGNLTSFVAEMEGITLKEAEALIRKRWIEKVPEISTLEDTVNKILTQKKQAPVIDPTYPEWILSKFTQNWDYMIGRGFKEETLKSFNVVYDPSTKFQGFPCYNLQNKLVGITGRNTLNQEPRYFPIIRFSKSHFLYNLNRVDPSQPVIAVEGEINCMSMHQHGYPNTIAFCGAGVSLDQLTILKNTSVKELIVFFDSDGPGQHGAKKIFKELWKYMKVKVVPDHEYDPAEMDDQIVKSLVEQADYFSIDL